MIDILFFTHLINGLLMILLPAGLGIYLTRRLGLGWRLWWIGAGTFILSQVGHIPFNRALTILFQQGVLPTPPDAWKLLFNAVVLGLSAGLWEELARYATYRWWAKDARSWPKGLILGAGHGGMESIILGALVLVTFVNLLVAREINLTSTVPADQLPQIQARVSAYWAVPWYDSLLGALERAFTLPFHLAASILVLQVFTKGQSRWLWLAVGWHALLNAGSVYIVGIWGPYAAEAWLGVAAFINIAIIFALRQPEPDPTSDQSSPVQLDTPMIIPLPDIEETPKSLEETRYN